MVYYLKYRPQKIGDLDSTKVRETLQAIFGVKIGPVSAGKPYKASIAYGAPHAFLFTGPKGLGKTSAARIVAKVINCSAFPDKREKGFEPCNKCEQCKSITNGTNLDVLEIDGASNRGIDEIRSLREKVNLAPANSQTKRKVYIIDEVHMLTTEAFNALLKTIEEPPKHVMFIFCTTEPHKVLETILSRCFHVSFSLATNDEIVHSLQRIREGEKLKISDELLYEIAKMAEGGFRDASKILEELVALHGLIIKPEHFQNTFHSASVQMAVANLLGSMGLKKTKESLEVIKDIVNNGVDLKFFTYQILAMLHHMLLEQTDVEKMQVRSENLSFTLDEISIMYNLFSEAYNQIKYSPIPQLPLEIAVISYGNQNQESRIRNQEESQPSLTTQNKNTVDNMRKKQEAIKIKNILSGKEESKKETKEKIDDASSPKQGNFHKASDESANLLENLIYKVKPYNHSVAGVLRGSKIESLSNDNVTFVTPYKFHKERLEDRKSCEIIEKAIKEITGKNLKVLVELKSPKSPK